MTNQDDWVKKENYEIIDKFKLKSRNYKNIFIREDYSSQEREEIRRYVQEAKKRNTNEIEVRWYVKDAQEQSSTTRKEEFKRSRISK